MKISALIPYKPDGGVRDYLWSLVKKRYETLLPEIELCVGYDDSEPFCRSRAINQAAKQAKGELFLLVDTDVVYDPALIDRIVPLVHSHPWIIPFYNGYRLTAQATERLIREGLPASIQASPEEIEGNDSFAGAFINIVLRDRFEAIQGMDERFLGWGGEDGALVYSLDTIFGNHYRLSESIYHLWHPRPILVDDYYQENMNLLWKYKSAIGNRGAMLDIIRGKEALWPERIEA